MNITRSLALLVCFVVASCPLARAQQIVKIIDANGSIYGASVGPNGLKVDISGTASGGTINSELQDGYGNPITSQLNGAQRALDVGVNVSGVQVDPRAIRALTGSDFVSAIQSGPWDVRNITGTVSLPTNACKEAGGNLDSIASALNVNLSSRATEATVAALNAKVIYVDTGDVTVSSSALPTGAATAARQDTTNSNLTSFQSVNHTDLLDIQTKQDTGNASLSSIDGKVSTATNQVLTNSKLDTANTNLTTVQGKQDTGNTSLASIDGKLNSLGQKSMTGGVPVSIASDQSAIPTSQSGTWSSGRTWTLLNTTDSVNSVQSGTWNVNNISGTVSLPTGAATSANQTTEISSLSTIDTDLKATQPRKMQDGSGNALTSQVSGSQRALDVGVNVAGVQVDPRDIRALTSSDVISAVQSSTWNINNITGTVSLPTGAATAANQTTANTSLSSIDGKLGSLGQKLMTGSAPVVLASDQSAVPVTQSGTWNINNVSGTVSLPTGAATSAKQDTGNTSLASIDGKFGSLGQKAMTGSAPVVIASDQSAIPASQNGTWTTGRTWSLLNTTDSVNAVQSGTWNINNVSGTVSLPTGAATAAKQPALGTAGTASADVISVQGISGMTALKVDGSAVTQSVSGTVTANAGTNLNTSALALETTQTTQNTEIGATNETAASTDTATSGLNGLTKRLNQHATTQETKQDTGNTSLSSIDGKLADNYGAASGALRVAAQVGNATAVADFNSGATSAQTLRVASNTYDGSGNAITSQAAGSNRPEHVMLIDAAGTIIGPRTNPMVIAPGRSGVVVGRTQIDRNVENAASTQTLYTVTSGKVFYLTSVTLTFFNSSITTVGRLAFEDNTTIKIPYLIPSSITGGPSQFQGSTATFTEPIPFSTSVKLVVIAGTLTMSASIQGYEE